MYSHKIEAAVSVMHVETSVKKYLDKFFKEYNLPVPRIKIVNSTTAKWLGRDIYDPKVDKNNTTIEIQKSITNDERTLDRVICHELIHHFVFVTKFGHPETGDEAWNQHNEANKLGFTADGHGVEFQKWADKINAVMGKDYVTKESDTSYVVDFTKEYFLLIMPTSKNSENYMYAWSLKPTSDQKEVILQKMRDENARLFMSKDERWTHGVKIKKYRPLSVPRDEPSKKKLKDLYHSGSGLKPNWPAPISKLSDFHKKMVDHYGKDMKDLLEKKGINIGE